MLSRTSPGQAVSAALIEKIAKLIHGEEGERLTAYPDEGGLWTIGKGHLILETDTVVRNGKPAHLHPFGPVREITADESDMFFERDTSIARNAVANKVSVPLTDNQRAALVSLVFNIGVAAFSNSTLLRLLNGGNYQAAADQFSVWKKVKGKDSPGLIARRARERALFLS